MKNLFLCLVFWAGTTYSEEYVIKRRNTLIEIGDNLGFTVKQLLAMNPRITVHTKLKLGSKLDYFSKTDLENARLWCKAEMVDTSNSIILRDSYESEERFIRQRLFRFSEQDSAPGILVSNILTYADSWKNRIVTSPH